jgi:hypothetical protein
VEQAQLRVGALGDVVEEVVAQIHGHGETFKDGEAEGEALCVKGVDGCAEGGEF